MKPLLWVVHNRARYPLLTNDVNVCGTLNLLEASLRFNVNRFIYASSATRRAVGHLEHAINASITELLAWKQEDKASCQVQSYDKETSINRE